MKEQPDVTNPSVREELAKKYVPLLHKIVNQFTTIKPSGLDYDDLVGFAHEGVVYALNTYKTGTSQTFQQYLGWCIRHKIQVGINEQGYLVKFSAYNQNKAKNGKTDFVSFKSIDNFIWNDNDSSIDDRLSELGVEDTHYNPQNIWNEVCVWVRNNFSKRDADMFIDFYGVDGNDPIEGKEIAKRYGVSSCCVSVTKKKIVEALRKSELAEDLFDLFVSM